MLIQKKIEELVNNMTFVPEIIFSNNDVVVVNKPYGMLVHEDWHSRGRRDFGRVVSRKLS